MATILIGAYILIVIGVAAETIHLVLGYLDFSHSISPLSASSSSRQTGRGPIRR